MSDADQLLLGMLCALESDGWAAAQSIARSLARHIQKTGEYPSLLPASEVEPLVAQHRASTAFGPS